MATDVNPSGGSMTRNTSSRDGADGADVVVLVAVVRSGKLATDA